MRCSVGEQDRWLKQVPLGALPSFSRRAASRTRARPTRAFRWKGEGGNSAFHVPEAERRVVACSVSGARGSVWGLCLLSSFPQKSREGYRVSIVRPGKSSHLRTENATRQPVCADTTPATPASFDFRTRPRLAASCPFSRPFTISIHISLSDLAGRNDITFSVTPSTTLVYRHQDGTLLPLGTQQRGASASR